MLVCADYLKSSNAIPYADLGVQYHASEVTARSFSGRWSSLSVSDQLLLTDNKTAEDLQQVQNKSLCKQLSVVSVHQPTAGFLQDHNLSSEQSADAEASDGLANASDRRSAKSNRVVHV